MARLILPRRFRNDPPRQRQAVHWAHPSAQGLQLVQYGTDPVDLVTGRRATLSGAPTANLTRHGPGLRYVASADYLLWSLPSGAFSTSKPFTALVGFVTNGATDTRKRLLRLAGPSGTLLDYDLWANSTTTYPQSLEVRPASGTAWWRTSLPSTRVGETQTTLACVVPSVSAALYNDRRLPSTLEDGAPGALYETPTEIYVGNHAGTYPLDGTISFFYLWNRAIGEAEAYDLIDNPWQLLRADPPRLYVVASAYSGASGTLASTESTTDTGAISGTVAISGTLASTESTADTGAISGTAAISGTLASTESTADSFSASAGSTVSGSMSAAEAPTDYTAISGQVPISAGMALSELSLDIAVFEGAVAISGTLAGTESTTDSFSASAGSTVTGTLAATESYGASGGLTAEEHAHLMSLANGLTAPQASSLAAVYAAHMHKRARDAGTGVITIYEEDGVTPFAVFDSNADISEITPQ